MLTGFLAADGFLPEVLHDLSLTSLRVQETHGRLVIAEGETDASPRPEVTGDAAKGTEGAPALMEVQASASSSPSTTNRPRWPVAATSLITPWAANTWHDVQRHDVSSIKVAASTLKCIQRNWSLYPNALHRRAALIAGLLPPVSAKALVFPAVVPAAPLGAWTLTGPNTLLAAARCSSPFPNGEPQFVEDRTGPPNRAYLKLWEALTLAGVRPGPGDRCLDLGASPGGWTWVAATLGADVEAIDKAPLAPAIAAMKTVHSRQMSAFALDPRDEGPVDWLLSDVVCYPERLLRLVERWLAAGTVRRFVCTVKFQGATDHAVQAAFAALPGRLVHLHHNKHELTWIKV